MRIFRIFLMLSFLVGWSFKARAFISITHENLPNDFLQDVLSYYVEGQEINPAFLNFNIDPNIHLFQEAEIDVTFIHDDTAFKNIFGYFLYEDSNGDGLIDADEISIQQVIFQNASQIGMGGQLQPGDTAHLGKFPAGTHMGFYIIANGNQVPQGTYYTCEELNPDGKRHLAMVAMSGKENVVMGIEDLNWAYSDRDFNDLIFTFTTNPKSALEEVIDQGNLPVEGPDSSPVPEFASPPPVFNSLESPTINHEEVSITNPSLHDPESNESTILSRPAVLQGSGMSCNISPVGSDSLKSWLWLLVLTLLWWFWKKTSVRGAD